MQRSNDTVIHQRTQTWLLGHPSQKNQKVNLSIGFTPPLWNGIETPKGASNSHPCFKGHFFDAAMFGEFPCHVFEEQWTASGLTEKTPKA